TREAAPEGGERLALGREGGHSRRRIVHAKDLTGREVERTLVAAVQRHAQIEVREHHLGIDLIVEREKGRDAVRGACVFDTAAGAVRTFRARAVVLATGG